MTSKLLLKVRPKVRRPAKPQYVEKLRKTEVSPYSDTTNACQLKLLDLCN